MNIRLLLRKVAVQLLQILHARLSPLRFLLNLSLLSFLVRVLNLSLNASSLHTLLIWMQGFNLHHLVAILLNNLVFYLVLNLIIVAILFTSRRGFHLTSNSQYCPANYYHIFQDSLDEDAVNKPYDIALAQYIPSNSNELSISYSKLPIPSAPSIELDNSYDGYYSYNIPSNDLAIASSSDLDKINSNITSNQLQLVPVSEVSLSQKTMVNGASPMIISSNQLELGRLGKQSIKDSCRLERNDKKPCNMLSIASPSNSKQVENNMVPIVGKISREKASQKSLVRHKSDTQARNHVANKYKFYGRTVSCTHYYEYTRDEACSTARLYTASTMDSLTREEVHKHFSDFTTRNWASVRKEST